MDSKRANINQQIKQVCDGKSGESGHPCRILVVEDNRAIADTIQLVLRHEGSMN